MSARYDRIGCGYARCRRADPRIAARIRAALADAGRVLDVGAGTGSYEPTDRLAIAVEPSRVMIAQRAPDAAPVMRAVAEELPLRDDSFDAALAILTVHHWRDPARGIAEMQRVAKRIVVFTWDPVFFSEHFWLARDYVPEAIAAERDLTSLAQVTASLAGSRVVPVPVPHDCEDGFFGAYWRRPEAYLDPEVRGAISGLARLDSEILREAVGRLAEDLASGAWEQRYGDLRALDELDLGYRLVVWERS